MDERFTYLVEKFLDHNLDEPEKKEFAKYLENPACREYLADAEKIDKIIDAGLRKIHAKEAAGAVGSRQSAGVWKKAAETLVSIYHGKWIKNQQEAGSKDQKSEITEDDIPDEIIRDVLKYGSIDDPAARQEVRRMHEQMIRRNRIKRLINYASAASLIVGLYFLWFDYLVPIPQSVFRAYYKQYEFAQISPATVPDERIRSAMSMYDKADFSGSAVLCRDIIASGTTEGNIHFLYGLNLMAMDSILQAIKEFDAQINSTTLQSTDRQPPVHWYKGLCYLQLNKPVAALWEIGKQGYRKFKEIMRL